MNLRCPDPTCERCEAAAEDTAYWRDHPSPSDAEAGARRAGDAYERELDRMGEPSC